MTVPSHSATQAAAAATVEEEGRGREGAGADPGGGVEEPPSTRAYTHAGYVHAAIKRHSSSSSSSASNLYVHVRHTCVRNNFRDRSTLRGEAQRKCASVFHSGL